MDATGIGLSDPRPLPSFAAQVRASLERAGAPHCAVDAFEVLPSTSTWLAARLQATDSEGPSLPRLCVVERQTDGVGRRGKRWHSEPGNITFSIASELSAPASALTAVGLVSGLAVATVLNTGIERRVSIKWPNDLLVGERKLGGVLLELLRGRDSAHSRVLTGIGINYRQGGFVHRDGLDGIDLASLGSTLPDRALLVAAIASRLLEDQTRFAEAGWQPFADRWHELDALCGHEVDVLRNGRARGARVRGVRDDGALLVEWPEEGGVEALFSGDVSIRPVPARD